MIYSIDVLAVLLATIVSFALGAIWYSPLMFLKSWCKETGKDPDTPIKNAPQVYAASALFTLLSALVLQCLLGPAPDLQTAVFTGLAVGAGIVAASLGINYQFSGRSVKLWLIDGGFHIARFTVMGFVFGIWAMPA